MKKKYPKKKKVKIFDGISANPINSYKSLWIAVITQTLMDALSNSKSGESAYHKHGAIDWLTGNSEGFRLICRAAGFHPDYIRRKSKWAIANQVKVRATPGTGQRYQQRKKIRKEIKTRKLILAVINPSYEDA